MEQEKIFSNDNRQVLSTNMYKQLMQFNHKKQPNQEMGRDLDIYQRRHTDDHQAYEKMFNMGDNQRNAN